MGFGEAIKVCMSKYATFSGRARRAEYWWFYLFMQLVYIPFSIVATILYMMSWGPLFAQMDSEGNVPQSALDEFNATPMVIGIVLMVVVGLAFLLPNLAVLVRRLHDTGRSGWWVLLSFVPFGNIVIFVFTLLDSEAATNQYGPDPKTGVRWSGASAAPAYGAAPVAQGAMPSYPAAQPPQPQPGLIQQPQAPAPAPEAAAPAAPPVQETPPAAPPAESGGTDDPFAQPPR